MRRVALSEVNHLVVRVIGEPGSRITITIVGVDRTPPTIAAAVSPPPNAAGWNATDVTVSFECTDACSGIRYCPKPVTVASEGAHQVVRGTAVDRAGNTASVSVTLNVDKSAPTIAAHVDPPPNAAGWNNSDTTVSFECEDGVSGIAVCPGPALVTTEGAGQTVSGVPDAAPFEDAAGGPCPFGQSGPPLGPIVGTARLRGGCAGAGRPRAGPPSLKPGWRLRPRREGCSSSRTTRG